MKDILKQAEEKMKKSIHVLSDEFAAVRAGRANPAILDKVMVDYYGAPTAINQLAAVSVSEAKSFGLFSHGTFLLRKALKKQFRLRIWVLIHKTTVK